MSTSVQSHISEHGLQFTFENSAALLPTGSDEDNLAHVTILHWCPGCALLFSTGSFIRSRGPAAAMQ